MGKNQNLLGEAIACWIAFYGFLDLDTSEEEIMNFYNSSPQNLDIYKSVTTENSN